jgi:hypothetical protein
MNLIGFLGTCFVGLTLINRVLEGQFILAADVSILNSVIAFKEVSVFNLFSIPVPNTTFITEGIPNLMNWNYSYFGGNAAILKYALYAVSGVVSFILFGMILGLLYNYFGKK